ncbi:MAG: amidohydrolase family protein [Pseudomonadota bacterium]
MRYDLIIKNGTVIDGSGLPRFQADIGISHGRIETIGRIRGETAGEVLDAEGHIVAPGFIDGHTHMDAQVAWDPLGTCSCWHGVTSVVMGNCGFTLAPCKQDEKHLVMRNLERAEDISPEAMRAGIDWTWETFSEYLDAVERFPKGINYAGYVGHSALRTYVMGERAFEESANETDLDAMKRELRSAIRAGAYGFTTSRTRNHQTSDDRPVASRLADWNEVYQLVCTMGEMNTGIFEIAGEDTGRDPERIRDYLDRLRDVCLDSGRPVTFGMFSSRRAPEIWRYYFDLLDETAAAGGRMFAQVHSRSLNVVLSFETTTPFDRFPVWSEIRALSLEDQKAKLRNPAIRAELIDSAQNPPQGTRRVGAEARKADFDWIFFMDQPSPPMRSIAAIAAERNADPVETMIDLALERDLKAFFVQPLLNEDQDHVLEMIVTLDRW